MERVEPPPHHPACVLGVERLALFPVSVDELLERGAFDEAHHERVFSVGELVHVADRGQRVVAQVPERRCLFEEELCVERRDGEVLLDAHFHLGVLVHRFVHFAESSFGYLASERVVADGIDGSYGLVVALAVRGIAQCVPRFVDTFEQVAVSAAVGMVFREERFPRCDDDLFVGVRRDLEDIVERSGRCVLLHLCTPVPDVGERAMAARRTHRQFLVGRRLRPVFEAVVLSGRFHHSGWCARTIYVVGTYNIFSIFNQYLTNIK